jgi:hypothetical protein
MAFRLIAISLRQVLRLLLLGCRSSRSKDLELLVLSQEIDVMRRQVPRSRFRPEEPMVLSVLGWLRPAKERLSSLVPLRHCGAGIENWCAPSGDSATGTLTCTANPASAVAGVATFAGCQITGSTAAGTYTLSAARSRLASGTSSNVVIT